MEKKKKCKVCGGSFVGAGEYCSDICKTTGVFVGGGGDTSKPNSTVKIVKSKVQRIGLSEEQKEKVREVFQLPIEERWGRLRKMSHEEQAFGKRISFKMLKEEQKIESMTDWEIGETTSGENDPSEDIGESDDGSI